MKTQSLLLVPLLLGAVAIAEERTVPRSVSPEAREVHFESLRMLTDGGENAEAYFSFDGSALVFQATRPGEVPCDRIFTLDLASGKESLVSTGTGRTTCGYFLPGDREVVFASTHAADPACPPPPDRSQGYVWPILPGYDLFARDLESGVLRQLTDAPGYDAEATVSPKGDRLVFTSTRDGDLDLYEMKLPGGEIRRLTDTLGYDGGAFYSPDGSQIVFRASRPEGPEAEREYRELLARGLVRPSRMELFVMDADGGPARQITRLGRAAFAPFFHPSGQRILFSSNHHDEGGREFDLFSIGVDGNGLEQLTFSPGFDGFPMFSPDGRWLAFASNRHNAKRGETNVFLARWKE